MYHFGSPLNVKMKKFYVLLVCLTVSRVSNALVECINGETNFNDTCDCFQGWSGETCDRCGGRIRITNSSGVITDDVSGSSYSGNTQCMFLIEADRPMSKIHLRFRLLHTECQWDYLHVFDGDSVFARKLASYTGGIKQKSHPGANINDSLSILNQDEFDIILSSTSSQILIYFYTDVAVGADGFEFDYWVDYTCPINCSGQGECFDNGTCQCDAGWHGELCDIPACPNNCSSHGECDANLCSCFTSFGGLDCSLDLENPFWLTVPSIPPKNFTSSKFARASHSAVLWRQNDMLVYGGYQFPHNGYSSLHRLDNETYTMVNNGNSSNAGTDEVLIYHIESGVWEAVVTSGSEYGNSSIPVIPSPRYGHTSILYNDTMYVYGGAKWPTEEIVNELWALDLLTQVWTPHFNISSFYVDDNATTLMNELHVSEVQFHSERNLLPLPVRSHTAHVVGSKMIILFGLSSGSETFVSYIQEYNFDTSEWSVPPQTGFPISGRMGHASVYDAGTGLIYVEGGVVFNEDDKEIASQLLVYNPMTHLWSILSASGLHHYLHTMVLFGPLLLVFGGCQGSLGDCYTNEFAIYNTYCDSWEVVEYPGLPFNSSRYSHSAILHERSNSLLVFGGFSGRLRHDLLQFNLPNCSIYNSKNDCLHNSSFCAWSDGEQGHCISVVEVRDVENVTYGCAIDTCSHHRNCPECSEHDGCSWSNEFFRCLASNSSYKDCSTLQESDVCSGYRYCQSCLVHDCHWNGSHCYSSSKLKEVNQTQTSCPHTSCFLATSCKECTENPSDCLWCPSLNHCVPSSVYPYYYIHGQCLGWVSLRSNCTGNCDNYKTCSDCQHDPRCGWCNDPSDTGLGECGEGGFSAPWDISSCYSYDDEVLYERWFFDICPACQCNGHSSCVNVSICEFCKNNTDGNNCEQCALGFWGDPLNGGTCQECDCNGYNSVCNLSTGICDCLSFGVTGDHCEQCDAVSKGDADNFCYSEMKVNFIYTYSVDMDREQEGFFVVTPPEDKDLNFKLEITDNPNNQMIDLQFFVGRKSESLWVLANLTDVIVLEHLATHTQAFDDFTSNSNVSVAQVHSFVGPTILEQSNFTGIFNSAVENDYTKSMWDGDVTLVIYLSNLTRPMTFKITVDQQDFLFLLYFFITFITCFSVLLTAFLLGWYIKQKIMMRNLLRQQYVELQRRVARPFARLRLHVDKLATNNAEAVKPQLASYVGVETCRDTRAAILTLFVQLPGNHNTGLPVVGRSIICVGSTLVRVNQSKTSRGNTQVRRRNKRFGSSVNTQQSDAVQSANNSTLVTV